MAIAAQPDVEREFAFSDEDFRFLADLANTRTGIMLPDHKRNMVYGRLARRLRALGLTAFSQYCELLQSEEGADEIGQLVNAITTNLTGFFREKHHFEHLANEVLAPLAQSKQKHRLRIWSAGCSSGMEPYSIAMTLRGTIREIDGWDARILATDIDSNMLHTGRTGEYAASDVENLPTPCRKYVEELGGGRVRMSGDLKKLIAFNQLNLLGHWPMQGPFDAIFCRNVVIYFDKPTKQTLFSRMADLLKPDGWLYIGHSENLHGISDRFKLAGRTVYRRAR